MKELWLVNTIIFVVQLVLILAGLYYFPESDKVIISLIGGVSATCLLLFSLVLFPRFELYKLLSIAISSISLVSFAALSMYFDVFHFGWVSYLLMAMFVILALYGIFWISSLFLILTRGNGMYFGIQTAIVSLPFGVGVIVGGIIILLGKKTPR